MEYLSKGSLDKVLIIEKDLLKIEDLITFSKHTAAGMQYLEENKIVHRDLALRNLLVAPGTNEKYIIKISDFGLSRIMEKDYYKTDDITMPIRWSAPEVLEKGIFTLKSDVWSFGIVLWEIFTFGKLPYFEYKKNLEVIEKILSGYKLEKPENCPNVIYELMLQCWNKNYEERPTFKKVCLILNNIHKIFVNSPIKKEHNLTLHRNHEIYN
jgi:serine/threonine protein kinase